MARWKLMQKHYLNVEGSTWEYRETTNSGRAVKKEFKVPQFLDPEYPFDCNYPRERKEQDRDECIVAHKGPAAKEWDYIFTGPPTPDMIPLDDEAKAITDIYLAKWGQPTVSDGDEGYTGKLLVELTETLQAFNNSTSPSSAANPDVITMMQKQMEKLMEMNMALMAKLEAPTATRRI